MKQDKIYIAVYPNYDLDGEHLADDRTDHPVQDFENIAYIRKDALLEWAKEMLKSCDGSVAMKRAYEKLTEHIELL